MEIRDFATALLTHGDLQAKLSDPGHLRDDNPGPPVRIEAPARAPNLAIVPSRQVKVPPVSGMRDPSQRARILHALANHELQAVELFAWALLAFPEAPKKFRRGLLAILIDEQRHFRLYASRLRDFNIYFGDYPLTGHFWNKLDGIASPLDFVCAMGLTFESANLDFAQDYAKAASDTKDEITAKLLQQIHVDEIRHVHFAWHWLNQFKDPDLSPWQAYMASIRWPLGPGRARGRNFDPNSRKRAGWSDDFIERLAQTPAKRPSGSPR